MAGLEISRRLTDPDCVAADGSGVSCWVMTANEPPFTILAASPGWHRLWEFSPADIAGKSTAVLNGVGYDVAACARVGQSYIASGSAFERCRNTSKNGQVLLCSASNPSAVPADAVARVRAAIQARC